MKERKKIEKEIENLTNARGKRSSERLQSNLASFDELIITMAKFEDKMFYFGEVSTQNTLLHFHKVILNSF